MGKGIILVEREKIMTSEFFEFEDKKILCETIKKIIYGLEFDDLPPAKILRSIEKDYAIILEFKDHFRYLVPQVYGWEFMDEYMYQGRPFPHKTGQPERREDIEARRRMGEDSHCVTTYYELCRNMEEVYYYHHYKKTGEQVHRNYIRTEKAAALCEELFYEYLELMEYLEGEAEYLQEKEKQSAILEKLYYQLQKYIGVNVDRVLSFGRLSDEFADNVIENKLVKCENTLSGDSDLNNFWEEYCVQIQQEHSFYWQTYLEQLYLWVKGEFEKLPIWRRNAIWLELKYNDITEYFEADYDPDTVKDLNLPFYREEAENIDVENKKYYDLKEAVDLIVNKIADKAADFTNKHIERYLFGYGADDDEL